MILTFVTQTASVTMFYFLAAWYVFRENDKT